MLWTRYLRLVPVVAAAAVALAGLLGAQAGAAEEDPDPLGYIIDPAAVDDPAAVADGELEADQQRLDALEQEISGRRRALFDRIDALQTELTRRYRTGEASVDTLLR